MTGFCRKTVWALLLGIAALAAARGATAQPSGSLKPGGAAIAKAPTAAAVSTPTPAKKVLVKPRPITGGTGKVSYGPGTAKARESAALLSSINGEAQGSHTTIGTARSNPLTRAAGIETVNGKVKGFVVTPGAHLAISGYELGDGMGQANLIGTFTPSGVAPLTIVDWKTGSIDVLLPTGLTGVLDQAVTLQVITAARRTYTHAGGGFVATRADTTVTTNIPHFMKFQSGPSWSATMDPNGNVNRSDDGERIDCRATGADTLTMIDPGKGFVVTGLNANWTGRTDSGQGDSNGDEGGRTFSPGYGFGDWNGASIPVRWGVWREHSSTQGIYGGMSADSCKSSYQITVNLNGPVGVSPF